MGFKRFLTLDPSDKPLRVRLYVRQIGERRAAMILRDDDLPPYCEELRGIAFFGDTPKQAEQEALDYLGMCAERN